MITKRLTFFGIFIITAFCASAQTHVIKARDNRLSYEGRMVFNGNAAALSWTGNSVQINFKGRGLKAVFKDEHAKNYLKVILDGKLLPDIHPDSIKHTYTLVSGLANTNHTLKIFKRTEWIFGKTLFYGFILDKKAAINQPKPKSKRKIEFYGNSITCGYGVIDSSGKDRGTPEYEDGYLSYAALTARRFNAQYSCIARSGIGVMVSWFPQIMPELYDRADPAEPLSKWNFKNYVPQVIVVNLMQNDSWIIKLHDNPQFQAKFPNGEPDNVDIVDAYRNFIRSIRIKNPNATIICALGNMDITKPGLAWGVYVNVAILQLHDKKVFSCIFPYKDSPGHPKVAEQQEMADQLIAFIEKKVKW